MSEKEYVTERGAIYSAIEVILQSAKDNWRKIIITLNETNLFQLDIEPEDIFQAFFRSLIVIETGSIRNLYAPEIYQRLIKLLCVSLKNEWNMLSSAEFIEKTISVSDFQKVMPPFTGQFWHQPGYISFLLLEELDVRGYAKGKIEFGQTGGPLVVNLLALGYIQHALILAYTGFWKEFNELFELVEGSLPPDWEINEKEFPNLIKNPMHQTELLIISLIRDGHAKTPIQAMHILEANSINE